MFGDIFNKAATLAWLLIKLSIQVVKMLASQIIVTFKKLVFFLSENYLFYPFFGVFAASVWLSFKSNFIQLRGIPTMLQMLCCSEQAANTNSQTVSPRTALFTAMSTSIGMGNIVGPIVAIGMGGPGALGGFVLATILGAAVTFAEVSLALQMREKNSDGSYFGGPMFYLRKIFSNNVAKFYAFAGVALLSAWSANQANNIAILLETKGVPPYVSGLIVACCVILVLVGGISRVGAVNDRLVPLMFVLFTSATSWIILQNLNKLPGAFGLIFQGLFSPQGAGGAAVGFGFFSAMRWGIARGIQANETGVGTATFPHIAAATNNAYRQGIIAMVSVFSTAFLCLLSGLTVMVTGAWLTPGMTFDIRMFAAVLNIYFPLLGGPWLILCAFMFAFGTILGNCYNASQCFLYLFEKKWLNSFYIFSACIIFWGCISETKFLWTLVDFFVLPVVIPNLLAILILVYKNQLKFTEK